MDFGMLFSRVCFHYGLGYWELMQLPVKTFWMLNKNINRLLAEKDMRALSVAVTAQNTETATSHRTALLDEFENPFKLDEAAMAIAAERDEDGFNDLRRMALGM